MSKRKLTNRQKALRSEYNKQRNRIKQFVNRRSKQGFLFDESIIPPSVKQMGSIQSRDVNRLKKLTADKIYAQSEYLDRETGDVVIGTTGKVLARKRKYINGEMVETYVEPPFYTSYEQIRDILISITHKNRNGEPIPSTKYEDLSNALVSILDNELNEYGQEYDEFLHLNSSKIRSLVDIVEYASTQEQLQQGFTQLSKALTMEGHLTEEMAYQVSEMTQYYDIEGALMV